MSAVTENMGKRALISQAYLVAYSALAALVGVSGLLWLLVFLFFIIFVLIQVRMSRGALGQGKVKAEEIESDKVIYEEKNLRELQMNDEGLLAEMQQQSKASMLMSAGTFAALLYFFLLWGRIPSLHSFFASQFGLSDKVAMFLAFLVYFEGAFVINQIIILYTARKMGKMPVINMPQGFKVTEKGIILQGLLGRQAIKFPLPSDVSIQVDERRKFVELVKDGKRSITKIRLYTRNPKRVYDLIVRLNRMARND